VLGMALSIQFGIAKTYALGVCSYAVCAIVIIASRWVQFSGLSAEKGGVSSGACIAGQDGTTIRRPHQ
jgi:hypothetical protein